MIIPHKKPCKYTILLALNPTRKVLPVQTNSFFSSIRSLSQNEIMDHAVPITLPWREVPLYHLTTVLFVLIRLPSIWLKPQVCYNFMMLSKINFIESLLNRWTYLTQNGKFQREASLLCEEKLPNHTHQNST